MNQESIFSSYADKRIKCILISMITASSVIMFVKIIMVIIIMIIRNRYHDQHDHPHYDHLKNNDFNVTESDRRALGRAPALDRGSDRDGEGGRAHQRDAGGRHCRHH